MADWPTVVRASGLIERTCPHGVGHPDPDSLAWSLSGSRDYSVHGCDGCCHHTPTSSPLHAVSLFSGIGLLDLGGDGTVRRLTPLECERLQGAPDGWTDGQSDSARYRQLGNAVAVPVFEWVAQRLVDVDAQIRGKVGASTRASLRLVHGTAHAGRALEARRK